MSKIQAFMIARSIDNWQTILEQLRQWDVLIQIFSSPPHYYTGTISPDVLFIEQAIYSSFRQHTPHEALIPPTPTVLLISDNSFAPIPPDKTPYGIFRLPFSTEKLSKALQVACTFFPSATINELLSRVNCLQPTPSLLIDRTRQSMAMPVSEKHEDHYQTRAHHQINVLNKIQPVLRSLLLECTHNASLHPYRTQLKLLEHYIHELSTTPHAKPPRFCTQQPAAESLSTKELMVASMITSGMTTIEIADHMFISPDTVKTHRKNIRKKLKLVGHKSSLADLLHDSFDQMAHTQISLS